MTKHCVENPWESQTEDGPSKESGEDGFLLPLYLHWRPSQEVAGDSYEGYHSWEKTISRYQMSDTKFVSYIRIQSTSLEKYLHDLRENMLLYVHIK